MHSPAIPALIVFSIASTVLTTPLHTPGAADATTDVITLAEKRSEIATREAKGIEWPCIWHCETGGICSCLEEREEAIVKREPAAVETRDEDFAPGHKPICFLCPPEEDEEEEEEVVTEKRAAAADDAIEEREEVVVEKEEDIMERDNLGCPICCCSDCYDGCFTA